MATVAEAETLAMFNGNGQPTVKGLPKLMIQAPINDVALEHIRKQTGLSFTAGMAGWLEAQPTDSNQITRLFLTYNFKTRYYNNSDFKNTLFLKNDHHVGYQVDAICYDCVKHNHIITNGLKPGDRLAA